MSSGLWPQEWTRDDLKTKYYTLIVKFTLTVEGECQASKVIEGITYTIHILMKLWFIPRT